MLANIIHQKANDLAHNAPTCGVNEAGPRPPEPVRIIR